MVVAKEVCSSLIDGPGPVEQAGVPDAGVDLLANCLCEVGFIQKHQIQQELD